MLQAYSQNAVNMPSFYYYDKNLIYIAFSDITMGMLSHEISHAIVSHYFVVSPPVKIQEILSGYTEYYIRKLTKESLTP